MSHRTFDIDKNTLCFCPQPVRTKGTNSAFMALSVVFISTHSCADTSPLPLAVDTAGSSTAGRQEEEKKTTTKQTRNNVNQNPHPIRPPPAVQIFHSDRVKAPPLTAVCYSTACECWVTPFTKLMHTFFSRFIEALSLFCGVSYPLKASPAGKDDLLSETFLTGFYRFHKPQSLLITCRWNANVCVCVSGCETPAL